jgi:hypothetical protein
VKFLVMWELDLAQLSTGVVHAVMRMPGYAQEVIEEGKLEARYHIVGKHGGAWIYDVIKTCSSPMPRLHRSGYASWVRRSAT